MNPLDKQFRKFQMIMNLIHKLLLWSTIIEISVNDKDHKVCNVIYLDIDAERN